MARVRVDLDGAHLLAVHEVTHVGVPGGCPGGCAAGFGFLDAALDDFVGEVAAVELGDRAHDAVEWDPGWGLVDVLGDRHQLHRGLLEGEVDADVIGAVAGETVDLVDDRVGDGGGVDELEEPLQFGAVGGAS